MKLSLLVFPLVRSEWTWNQDLLNGFKCKDVNSWQLPQECGANCGETDKTFHRCSVEVTMQDSNFILKSNGIPDHNACAAPPRSTILEIDYEYSIPLNPTKRSGNPSSFSATN